tara:strand:- start:6 stop:473 length:468 start_codon:yes stop_codon:yes gene_type:complete
MTMLSRTPVVVSSPSSSSKKRRRERLCYAKATSSKPNNASTTKTPVPATKKTKDVTTLGENQRRRDVFAVGVLFLSLGGASSSKESAFAYGTGGWKDCEPICDSLKGGFAAQQKLQEEMMRQSMGGDDTGAEAKEESKGKKAAVSEREKRKKNLR